MVRARRTSLNLFEPNQTKVWRVLSLEFGEVRLYRTFSSYIVTGETRCAGCLCPRSVWFKHSEPPRTFSNHLITELARCVEFCHLRSGWFDGTEPCLSTALQGQQGVQCAAALVRGGSSASNLLEPSRTTSAQSLLGVAFFHLSSVWFDCTEPSMPTSLHGKQGVQHLEPPRTSSTVIVAELARQGACRSGWFKHSAPQQTFSNHLILSSAFTRVRGGAALPNFL